MEVGKDSVKVGDEVTVTMQGQHNGCTGRVVGLSAKGSCIVMLWETRKTIQVMKEHVEKFAGPSAEAKPARASYSIAIAGTSDNWILHTMEWSEQTSCYKYIMTLNSDNTSFMILKNGDWNLRMHPPGPNTHWRDLGNSVYGPDEDSDVSLVWTIGSRQEDCACPGAKYLISLVDSSQGSPGRVWWDKMRQPGAPNGENPSLKTYTWEQGAIRFGLDALDVPWEEVNPAVWNERAAARELQRERAAREQRPKDPVGGEDQVVQSERAARERLAKRLMMANLAIADGGEDLDDEMNERRTKVEANKRRYEAFTPARQYVRKDQAIAAVEGTRKAALPVPPVPQGVCIECGKTTGNVLDVGSWCCEPCWEAFQEITKDGWDSTTVIDGRMAARHVDMLREQDPGLTLNLARREVMNQNANAFSKAQSSPLGD